MALRVLILVSVACADSVSRVSFSLGDRAPISYEIHPDAGPEHSPATRKHHSPMYTTPPSSYTTLAPITGSHRAYTSQAPNIDARSYNTTTKTFNITRTTIYQQSQYKPLQANPPKPVYHPKPVYYSDLAYHPDSTTSHVPSYKHPGPAFPTCAALTNSTWCLADEEYPEYEIKNAIQNQLDTFSSLYADVAELDTELSVQRPNTLYEETYLCPSETSYIHPLRAQNTNGIWRVIVNGINVHYKTYTQTVRIEECLTAGKDCPLVPVCYESKCLQKSVYHRFLVYDPYDQYFPFAIETFKLPASCACLLGASNIDY